MTIDERPRVARALTAGLPAMVGRSWLPVALSRDLKSAPIARTIAGLPIVLFRSTDGVAAFKDRCPHRNYPLSRGRMREGSLECAYHGWRFGMDGRCVAVPGCALDEQQPERLEAETIAAIERYGAIFVRPSPEGEPEPRLPELLGAPGHDHFWWAQGCWRGRAIDAIENVLDPFHTNFIHDGFIRKSGARMPVTMTVNVFEDGIEAVIDQDQPDLGLMSRALEGPRKRSRTRFYPPATIQARWEGPDSLTLCVTAFFTPETESAFRPFACFTTPKGRGPGWLKEAAIRLFLAPVVAQDRKALAKQLDSIERFEGPRFKQGPGDFLGARVAQLYQGERLNPTTEGPFAITL